MTATPSGPALIDSAPALADLVATLADEPRYALDTEFHLERTYHPRPALIQLAWGKEVALVDPLALDVTPLARVFTGPGVAVAHACDQDLEVLEGACGAAPARLFDTQVAAGFLGWSNPALSRLVEQLCGRVLPKADRLTDWTRRPLSVDQRAYAAADVAHLLELHDLLTAQLEERGRLDWAIDECAQLAARRRRPPVPEEAWWKMGDRRQLRGASAGVAQEVAAWRERRAAALDRQRRSVLGDLALSAIAQRPPRTRAELEHRRGVERRHLAGGAADEILAAVRRGIALPEAELRLPPAGGEPERNPAGVAVAAGLVRHLSDTLGIDAALLATRADLGDLAAGRPTRVTEGWRRQAVGQPLLDLFAGRLAVVVQPDGLALESVADRRGS